MAKGKAKRKKRIKRHKKFAKERCKHTASMFPSYSPGEVVGLDQLIREKRVIKDKDGYLTGEVEGHYKDPSSWRHKEHPRITVMRDTRNIAPPK